jgi:hypothetical protein
MRKINEILEQAKRLSVKERQRLIEELEDLEDSSEELEGPSTAKRSPSQGPYARTLAAAGTVHSDFDDLSTDKYKHVAAAADDQREDE